MKISPRLVAPLVYVFYRLWCSTLRFRETGRARTNELFAKGEPMIFGLWHGEFFPLMYMRRHWKLSVLVSRSKDGEFIAKVLEALGFATFRGSSSRGGAEALLHAAKDIRETGRHACITLDGPRGPRHKAKDGFIFLATNAPAWVVPLRAFMPKAKVFRSWDKFRLPLPFSKVEVVFGEPYRIEPGPLTDEVRQVETARLEQKLAALEPRELDGPSVKLVCYRGLARLMGDMSLGATRKLAVCAAFLLRLFLPSRLRAAQKAVREHLHVSEAEAKRIAVASFTENFYSFLEIFHVSKFRRAESVSLDVEPYNHVAVCAEAGPVVVATAHIGSWELMASLATDFYPGRDRMVVVRKQRDPDLNRLMADMRGARGIAPIDHRLSASVVLPRLRKDGVAAFLVDHNCSRKEAVFLPFLGDIAAVNAGPAMIALRAKAVVYPVFLLRDGKGGHILHVHDPLRTGELTGSIQEKLETIARFYTDAVAQMVKKYPEQWFWMHKRWKTRPPKDWQGPITQAPEFSVQDNAGDTLEHP